MSDVEILLQKFEKSLTKKDNEAMLQFILKEIYIIIALIKTCKDQSSAGRIFSSLEKIQSSFARAFFIDGITLPQELRKIVRDCDRLDDQDVRDFLFNEIKNGTYELKSDTFLWYPMKNQN